ncbi:MAG: NHL repeat-containing protein [Candidatus Latescibacteria bacterium]|nr:NHL repeat-containing protein [Candidatus Latescibacterota bacterium]
MIRFPVIITLLSLCSCASSSFEKSVPPVAEKVTPPAVTGSLRLTYSGTLGTQGEIRAPWGISFGVDGTLYVCDRDKSSVVRLNGSGEIISRFDSFTNRTERLYAPIDVCSSSGIEIYAVDASDSRVLRFDRNLKNGYTIYRGGADQTKLFGSFNGIAYDKISGDLYITDRDTGAVIRIDMLGRSIRTMGAFGSRDKSLREPAGLDVDPDGILYIADTKMGAVAVVRNFGAHINYIGGDALEAPVDAVVMDGGNIAVADSRGVVVFNPKGAAAAFAGYGVDRIMKPHSVAYKDGKLYISDGASASILVYTVE